MSHIASLGIRRIPTSDLLAEVEYVRYELASAKKQEENDENKGYLQYIQQRAKYLLDELARRADLRRQGEFPIVPTDFINRVRDNTDLQSLFDHFLGIYSRLSGQTRATYTCPAHPDKHPSGILDLKQPQHYHCFQCNAHGDCYDALMAFKGMTFMQAVEACASYLGWSMPQRKRIVPTKELPRGKEPRGFFV